MALNAYPMLKNGTGIPFAGGAELQQALLGKELARRSYEVTFVTKDHGQPLEEEIDGCRILASYRQESGLPVIRFFYPRMTKLWQALDRAQADVYYVRCAGLNLAPVVFHARRKRKKSIFSGANAPDFDPARLLLESRRERMSYLWALKRCDRIIVQNKAQQGLLREHFGREATIIHNGLPKADRPRGPAEHILWVSRLAPHKNPRLFPALAAQFPEQRFVMIGRQSVSAEGRRLYEEVRDVCEGLPNMTFTGFLPPEQVEPYFDSARVLVNTSEYEGFPNTFLQAWSRGIPVLSFVDPDDLIRDHALGWVVKNAAELSQTLGKIVAGQADYSGQYIRGFFERHLTIEATCDRYEEEFEALQE